MEPVFTSNKERINRKIAHRAVGIFLSAAMVYHMLPVDGLAVYASEEKAGLCRHHTEHTAECGYEETRGEYNYETDESSGYTEVKPCMYHCRICPIEDLIDGLPDAVTEDNADEVEVQLKEILALFSELTEEEQEQISDLSPCYRLQEELLPAGSDVKAEKTASAMLLSQNDSDFSGGNTNQGNSDFNGRSTNQSDLDFSSGSTNSGNLDTDGYEWNAASKTLKLKDVTIDGTVTLPDAKVTIETAGNCSIDTIAIYDSNPANTNLIFSGSGVLTESDVLTIEKQINISGGDNNRLTVNEGANVKVIGGISIGASGGVSSIVTVNGTLTISGGKENAIYAGKVVVGGTLDVSGENGVLLNGMGDGIKTDKNFSGAFTIQKGGCFTANCTNFNIRVDSGTGVSFPEGSNANQAIIVPDGYLPTDCEVKQEEGNINLVRKSTGQVYTGALTIHENHNRSDSLVYDETTHWYKCTFLGCDKKIDEKSHIFDSTGKCTCGAVLTVTLNATGSMIYTGQEKKPEVIVYVGGKVLDKLNYSTSYSNNINAGDAFVTVTGTGGLSFKQTVDFHINKAVPRITWGNDAVQTVTYSGRPAEITPPAVTLANNEKFGGQINYSYASDGSNDTPGLPINAGVYTVKASIAEQSNYTASASTDTLKLTVEKANAPNMPSDAMKVAKKCEKVSDVELPEGWQWQEAYKNTPLEIDVPEQARADYIGPDKDNYKNVTVTVTITRSACDHENTELRNVVAATCLQKGYSGDKYCLDCGELLEKGRETELAEHSGGTATCVSGKICEVCGTEYTAKDSGVHLHTETRGQMDASCTADGYTGDTFCTDCNAKISSGTAIPATEHDWHVTGEEAATAVSEGKRYFTCSKCGAVREEVIPKLPSEEHEHNYSVSVVKEATCTEAGEKKYTCDCGDSYTESIPALGHSYYSTVTQKPTVSAEGVRTYTCSRCGDTYTEPIKKLPSTPSKPGGRPEGGTPSAPGESDKAGGEIIIDETDKAGSQSTTDADRNGSAAVPPKSTGTDDGSTGRKSPQTGQPRALRQMMAAGILVIIMSIGGVFAVRRKKRERERVRKP